MDILASAGWRALGTDVGVFVHDPAALAEARRLVEQDLAALDLACSRFRADSELSRLNTAPGRWIHAGPLLLDAVDAGLRAARLTGGVVDPTIGRSLRLAGYDRDFDRLGAGGRRRVTFVAAAGWRVVELDRERSRIRVPAGVELDLGATAKALGADRSAARVAAELGCGVMVSLGGDIAVAGVPPVHGWPVRVTGDERDAGQWIALRAGGLATSSTTLRRWPTAAGTMHHILDPATGRPATGTWSTVSVTAGSCVDANTASTAAVVHGTGAPRWLSERRLPARLAAPGGHVVRVCDWPAQVA